MHRFQATRTILPAAIHNRAGIQAPTQHGRYIDRTPRSVRQAQPASWRGGEKEYSRPSNAILLDVTSLRAVNLWLEMPHIRGLSTHRVASLWPPTYLRNANRLGFWGGVWHLIEAIVLGRAVGPFTWRASFLFAALLLRGLLEREPLAVAIAIGVIALYWIMRRFGNVRVTSQSSLLSANSRSSDIRSV